MDLILYLSLVSVCIFSTVDSLMFHLDPNTRKCLKEEIHKGVLVTGEYEVKYNFIYVNIYKYNQQILNLFPQLKNISFPIIPIFPIKAENF